MKRGIARLVGVTCLTAGSVYGQNILQGGSATPHAPQNTLATALDNVGLTQCRPALNRLSALALVGARANDVLLDWDRQKPGTTPIFTLIGLEFPNGAAAFSLAAVPGDQGTCTLSAERIAVAPLVCAQLAQQELTGLQATRLLPTFTVYVDPRDAPGSTVSLLETERGCLVIRRYVVFGAAAPRATSAPMTGASRSHPNVKASER